MNSRKLVRPPGTDRLTDIASSWDEAFAKLGDHRGYVGVFTRDRSPLAKFGNGARIVKTEHRPNDGHPVGALGTVLGSIGHQEVGVVYFIEWDNMPGNALAVAEHRIGAAAPDAPEPL